MQSHAVITSICSLPEVITLYIFIFDYYSAPTDGVVAPRVVVGRVLLPRDHVLRVEEMFVGPHFDLLRNINIGGL